MASESIYSSYSDSPEFSYNQPVSSILKKSSSPSSSPKSVSFAYTMHDFLEPTSPYQRISLTDNWPYQYPTVSEMKDAELFMAEDTRSDKRRQIVGCFYCHFVVFVDKWHYINPLQAHFDVCSNCPCVQDYKEKLEDKTLSVEIDRIAKEHLNRALLRIAQKQEEDRQVEKARLTKKHAERLAEQDRIEKTRAEKIRLAKERAELLQQQKAEQARIAKKQSEAFACRRCSAKFPNNIKFHIHVQDHHQKKVEKSASEPAETTPIAVSAPVTFPSTPKAEPVTITTSEPAPKAVATMPTSPATPSSPSEPTLVLTSSPSQSKPTSKPSFPDTSPVIPKQSSTAPTATPRTQISWAEIASRSIIASKPSRLPISTPKPVPNALETAAVACPSTSPPTSPQKPVPKHQHQKSYLTIDDLFEMFAEKRPQSNLLHTKKRASSPSVSSLHQTSITSYFRPAANQSRPIS
ncbi:hypothetical protein G7Y79_00104g101520 [Physcia stellaris]|nr:hypothetical protein G7Y79_00104g101520 [Physcia stellaris]